MRQTRWWLLTITRRAASGAKSHEDKWSAMHSGLRASAFSSIQKCSMAVPLQAFGGDCDDTYVQTMRQTIAAPASSVQT
jgi:hypothetical protein